MGVVISGRGHETACTAIINFYEAGEQNHRVLIIYTVSSTDMMDKNDKSLLSSFRRAFRPSSTRREKTHSTKRKDHRSGGGVVFPEDNAESRYEDMSNFTLQQYDRSKQKSGRKAMHTFSESRKDRPIPPPIRSPIPLRGLPATAHGGQSPANNTATRMIKSSTLPGKRPSRHPPPSPPGPTAHTVRIPPPRHSKRTRLPLPSPTDHLSHYSSTNQIQFMYHSPEHHTPAPSLLPAAPYIPSHAMSTIDMTNGSSATTQLVQRKTAVNISRTGPSTLPHDYCEPFAWLQPHQQQQQQTTTYCTISPPAHNVDQHKSSWIDMGMFDQLLIIPAYLIMHICTKHYIVHRET